MRPMPMDDPRDNLEKATRWELYEFAKQSGCLEVREPMPADLAAHILRAKGLTNIRPSAPPLGSTPILGKSPYIDADQTVDALSDLKRQYEHQQKHPDVPEKAVGDMTINELRSAAKSRGIKLSRRDTMETLKAKLNGG